MALVISYIVAGAAESAGTCAVNFEITYSICSKVLQ